MGGAPSGGKGGHGAQRGLGPHHRSHQREAFADDPVEVRDRTVVKDGAVGTNDGCPAKGRGAGHKRALEIFPAVFPAKAASLSAMSNLNDFAAAGGEGARCGFVETFARISSEPGEDQSGTQRLIAQADGAVRTT